MSVKIQFFDNINEDKIPIIRLTKSSNKKTGTATFLFIFPTLFKTALWKKKPLLKLSLFWKNNKTKHLISTSDLKIIFKNGKPFLIKSIFLFKNSKEWFEFLNFMQFDSKERGLSFLPSS